MVTLKQKEKFLRNRNKVRKVILSEIRKEKGIIYGARAVNKQIPKHLRVSTEDYDVLTDKDPKKLASRIERRLDKKFGGNFYKVKQAQHKGTHKVVNNLSGKGIVDTSKREGKVGVIKRKGIRYANLQFQKKKIRESLSNPEAKFRHQKDRFTRDRIKLAKKSKQTKSISRRRNKHKNDILNIMKGGKRVRLI